MSYLAPLVQAVFGTSEACIFLSVLDMNGVSKTNMYKWRKSDIFDGPDCIPYKNCHFLKAQYFLTIYMIFGKYF